MARVLNACGYSPEAAAAEYESDAALQEWMAENPSVKGMPPSGHYFWAAWAAEMDERELDRKAAGR